MVFGIKRFSFVSFDGDVLGLYDYLSEYENLDELNHLAHLLSELDQGELETLEAVLNKGDHTSSVADIINLVHNLDCYDLHPRRYRTMKRWGAFMWRTWSGWRCPKI